MVARSTITSSTRITPKTLAPRFRKNTVGGRAKVPYYQHLWRVANSSKNTVGEYLHVCNSLQMDAARYPGKNGEVAVKPIDFVTYSLERGWLAVN